MGIVWPSAGFSDRRTEREIRFANAHGAFLHTTGDVLNHFIQNFPVLIAKYLAFFVSQDGPSIEELRAFEHELDELWAADSSPTLLCHRQQLERPSPRPQRVPSPANRPPTSAIRRAAPPGTLKSSPLGLIRP
jgi:hypothetical protein